MYLSIEGQAEMGPITFESNHYHYNAISSLPLPLHTFWKCNHYHYFGNVIHYHYTLLLATHTSTGLAVTK